MADNSLVFKLGADLNELQRALSQAQSNLLEFGGIADKVQEIFSAWQVKVAVAAAAVGTAFYKIGADFDTMRDTLRVGTGATGQALEGLAESTKKVFAGVPASIGDVSKAMAELNTRTGLTGPALETLATQTLNLARITGEDLNSIIAATTRVFGDWSVSSEQTASVMDYLFRVSQSTGIGVTTLAEKVVQFGAPLRQMGFGLEEAAALLGKFEKEGVNADLVLSSLRIALTRMATEGVTDSVAGLKMITQQIQEAGSAAAANELAVAAFGAKAGPDMAAAIREGRFEVGELLNELRASPETINQAAKDTDDLSQAFVQFKNAVMVAAEPLATALFEAINSIAIPALKTLGEWIGNAVQWFREFDLDAWVSSNLSPFGSALGPVVGALKELFAALGPLIASFAELAGKLALLYLGATVQSFINLWKAIEPVASVVGRAAAAFGAWAIEQITHTVRNLTLAFETLLKGLSMIPGVNKYFDNLKSAFASSQKEAANTATATANLSKAVSSLGSDAQRVAGSLDLSTRAKQTAAAAARDADKEMRALDSALRAFGVSADGSAGKTSSLKAQLDILKRAWEEGKISSLSYWEALQKYNAEVQKSDPATRALESALKTLRVEKTDALEKATALNVALQTLRAAYEQGKISIDQYNQAVAVHRGEMEKLYPTIYSNATAFSDLAKAMESARPSLDSLQAQTPVLAGYLSGMADQTNRAWNEAVTAQSETLRLAEAYQQLGITSSQALADKAAKAREAYDVIRLSGTASAAEIDAAYKAMIRAQQEAQPGLVAAHEASFSSILQKGIAVFSGPGSIHDKWSTFSGDAKKWMNDLASHAIGKLFTKSPGSMWGEGTIALTGLGGAFQSLVQTAGPAMSSLASDMINKLFSGEGSWKEIGLKALDALLSSFTSWAAQMAMQATGLAKTLSQVFTGIKIPSIPGLGGGGTGDAGSAVGGAASEASNAISGAVSSLVGAIGSAAGAVSSIIGNFQMSGMNKTLDIIAKHTLETKSEVENLRSDSWMREDHLFNKLDDWRTALALKLDDMWQTLLNIYDASGSPRGDGGAAVFTDMLDRLTTIMDKLGGLVNASGDAWAFLWDKLDDAIRPLQRIADNTTPRAAGVSYTADAITHEGLRNINTSLQAAKAAIDAGTVELNAFRNNVGNVAGVKEAIVGQLALIYDATVGFGGVVDHLRMVYENTRPSYLFFSDVLDRMANRAVNDNRNTTISIHVDNADSARIANEIVSALRLAGQA